MASAELADGPPIDGPPMLEEARGWVGHRLDEIGGGRAGSVAGLLVGIGSLRAEWMLAQLGRFGHHTPVPSRDAVEGAGRIWVPYSRELIRTAPWLEPGEPLRAEVECELFDHYGIVPDAARAAFLATRPSDAVTARPA